MKFNQWLIGIGLLILGSIQTFGQAEPVGLSAYGISGTGTLAGNPGTNWAIIPGEAAQQINNSQGIPTAGTPQVGWAQLRASLSTGTTFTSYYSTNQTYFNGTGITGGSLLTNQVPINGTNGVNIPCWCVIHHVPLTNYVFFTNVIYGQTNVITRLQPTYLPVQIADEALYMTSFANGAVNIITNTLSTITNAAGSITTNTFTVTNALIAFSTGPISAINPGDEVYYESVGASMVVPGQALTVEFPSTGIVGFTGQRRKPLLFVLTSATANTNFIDAVNAQFIP
jgi:hypothetical protein